MCNSQERWNLLPNTLDYVLSYTWDVQCIKFCVDELQLLRVDSDNFALFSLWNYQPLTDYIQWSIQGWRPLRYAKWQEFIMTGIEECAKFDVEVMEHDVERVEKVYKKILDIFETCGVAGVGKRKGVNSRQEQESERCQELHTCLTLTRGAIKRAQSHGAMDLQIQKMRQMEWEIQQNIKMEVCAKLQSEKEDFADSLLKAND